MKGEKIMQKECFFKQDGNSAVPEYPGEFLVENGKLLINHQEDLSGHIKFDKEGCVYGITLTGSPGFYDYVVNVDAKGPKGFGSGYGYLHFTDETGDVYELKIYSSHRSVHTVRYNSQKPSIVKIEWHS